MPGSVHVVDPPLAAPVDARIEHALQLVATEAKLFAQPRFVLSQALERALNGLAVHHHRECGSGLLCDDAEIARREGTRFRLWHDAQLAGRLQDGKFHVRHVRVALFAQLRQQIVDRVPDAAHFPVADAAMRNEHRRFPFNPVAEPVTFHLKKGDGELKQDE